MESGVFQPHGLKTHQSDLFIDQHNLQPRGEGSIDRYKVPQANLV